MFLVMVMSVGMASIALPVLWDRILEDVTVYFWMELKVREQVAIVLFFLAVVLAVVALGDSLGLYHKNNSTISNNKDSSLPSTLSTTSSSTIINHHHEGMGNGGLGIRPS